MRGILSALCLGVVVVLAASAFATVTATSPASGATVASPVTFAGTGTTTTCTSGVASMGVYIDNVLTHVSNGNSLSVSLPISAGKHKTVIEEWDYCGGASFTILPITVTAATGVWVSFPANNSAVTSPVSYKATASTSTCGTGVSTMGIYVNNQLTFVSNGATLNTQLSLNPGTYNTVVEEWDHCGGASYTPVKISVTAGAATAPASGGKVLSNIQASKGWKGYGEYPPLYDVCTACGSGVSYSMSQGVTSPSMTGKATKFNISLTTPYADVLWTNPLIGDLTTQGLPDPNKTLVKSIHNFVYDAYFYGANLEVSQVLEFDISQYFGGMSFILGTQCRIAGGHGWDVWDNVNSHWVSTGVACHPVSGAWNHVRIVGQRTSANQLFYQTIELNGSVATINRYYGVHSAPSGWNGITVNFQEDGNAAKTPYSVVLDNFSLTYQ